jgi:hypothetical protein
MIAAWRWSTGTEPWKRPKIAARLETDDRGDEVEMTGETGFFGIALDQDQSLLPFC